VRRALAQLSPSRLQYESTASDDGNDPQQNRDIGERRTELAFADLQHRCGREDSRLSFDIAAGHLRCSDLRDRAPEAR